MRGTELGRDIVSLGVALQADLGRNLLFYGSLDAAWRRHQDVQSILAGLKYIW